MSQMRQGTPAANDHAARRALMATCARASLEELLAAAAAFGESPDVVDLRAPEVGLVMLRGRVGGSGPPFNLGEATVTRASVRVASGEIGHGHVLGRHPRKARLAAILDALGQIPAERTRLQAQFVEVVAKRVARQRDERAQRVAATKVDFFTMARGDD